MMFLLLISVVNIHSFRKAKKLCTYEKQPYDDSACEYNVVVNVWDGDNCSEGPIQAG